jgi:hypothetical protein
MEFVFDSVESRKHLVWNHFSPVPGSGLIQARHVELSPEATVLIWTFSLQGVLSFEYAYCSFPAFNTRNSTCVVFVLFSPLHVPLTFCE